MPTSVKISSTIICFNEEAKIARTLESLVEVVDQIVVIDSHSTDKTIDIVRSYENRTDIKLLERPFAGYIEQKNFALEQCDHDVILSLDADEALSDELKKSILEVKENWQGVGYTFNRLTNYGEFWVRHCGWYPDTKLRLVKKGSAHWRGVNPHDILTFDKGNSSPKHLRGDLLHYSYDSVTDHVHQTNRFTTIAAKASYEKGTRSNFFKIVTRPFFKFLRDYIWKLGFLDGRYGLIICSINALSAFLKYTKIYELQNGRQID